MVFAMVFAIKNVVQKLKTKISQVFPLFKGLESVSSFREVVSKRQEMGRDFDEDDEATYWGHFTGIVQDLEVPGKILKGKMKGPSRDEAAVISS